MHNYFSIFVQFFSRTAPHFFGRHDSPSNMASPTILNLFSSHHTTMVSVRLPTQRDSARVFVSVPDLMSELLLAPRNPTAWCCVADVMRSKLGEVAECVFGWLPT